MDRLSRFGIPLLSGIQRAELRRPAESDGTPRNDLVVCHYSGFFRSHGPPWERTLAQWTFDLILSLLAQDVSVPTQSVGTR